MKDEQGQEWDDPATTGCASWEQAVSKLIIYKRFGVPFAFVHPEIGICPYNHFDTSTVLFDVEWYDVIQNEWLDPIDVVFHSRSAQERTGREDRSSIAFELIQWLKELHTYTDNDNLILRTHVPSQVYQNVSDRVRDMYGGVFDDIIALYRKDLKIADGQNDTALRAQLKAQLLSGALVNSVYIGVDFPDVFTDVLVLAPREVFPNAERAFPNLSLQRIGVDYPLLFVPPLTREFTRCKGYSFAPEAIRFAKSGSFKKEIISVSVTIETVINNEDGTSRGKRQIGSDKPLNGTQF